jgi:hypothetical protein
MQLHIVVKIIGTIVSNVEKIFVHISAAKPQIERKEIQLAKNYLAYVGPSSSGPPKKTTTLCDPCPCGKYVFKPAPDHV